MNKLLPKKLQHLDPVIKKSIYKTIILSVILAVILVLFIFIVFKHLSLIDNEESNNDFVNN